MILLETDMEAHMATTPSGSHALQTVFEQELEYRTSFQGCLEVAALFEPFDVTVTAALTAAEKYFFAGLERGQSSHLSSIFLVTSKHWPDDLAVARTRAANVILERYREHEDEWHHSLELLDATSAEPKTFQELRSGALAFLIKRAQSPRDLLSLAGKTRDIHAQTSFLIALTKHPSVRREHCVQGLALTSRKATAALLAECSLSLPQ